MKKFLAILVMSLLFISNAYATHFLTKKARAVCKVSQDIDLIMNWKHDDGSWEVEEFSLKKGDYLRMHFHKKNGKNTFKKTYKNPCRKSPEKVWRNNKKP